MKKFIFTFLFQIFIYNSNCQLIKGTILDNYLPIEKIYLHSDRSSYMQGDTVWFKAYSWFGFDQLPDTVSKVLYVDLLSSKGKAELKKKLLIQNGTSTGDFILNETITPGKYTIRAYTRWMQNKGAGEPFYQTITINSTKEYFQVECLPHVIKQKDGDSLLVAFRFYEIDNGGDLKEGLSHNINYSLRIGDQELTERPQRVAPTTNTTNTREQIFRFRLPKISKKDSVALVTLSINDDPAYAGFEKQFRIPLKEELDLQFFPEGGSLVNGIESRVAFKAIGTDGLSRKIKGVVRETGEGRPETGEVIISFESIHKGMGDFLFTPQKNKKYTAWVEYNNRLFNFPLPTSSDEAIALSVYYSESADTVHVRVKYSPSKENDPAYAGMYLTGSAYGKIRFITTLNPASAGSPDSSAVETRHCFVSTNIPAELLPEGISHITLLNSDFKPISERLIYNEKGERFKVEVTLDSTSYGLRSKVTLQVKTKDLDGNPVPSNLSLSVVDKEQVIKNSTVGSISSFKLLESELKGYFEDPGYYFSGNKTNHKALDLLLMTQGYRRFLPKKSKPAEIKYFPERTYDINGKVVLRKHNNKNNFNYSDLVLNYLCSSGNSFYDQTRPDSLGDFSLSVPLQYGKPLALLRAYTSPGKMTRAYMDNLLKGNQAYTSSGRLAVPKEKSFKGDILIDEQPSFVITPPIHLPEITSPVIDYVRQLQEAKKSELSKLTNGIKWQINLPEVTIKAKSKDKEWYSRFEYEANKIVDMDSLDPTGKKYGNVYDLLVREFGARRIRDSRVETVIMPTRRGFKDWFPIYVINGKTYYNGGEGGQIAMSLLNMLSSIKVNEIKKIMVLPYSNLTYYYADPGILGLGIRQSLVNIETYSKNTFRGDPDGIRTFIIDGLDSPRIFYSPRYEGSNKNNLLYDGRATIYWNPSLSTDVKGETKIAFYTSDRKTEFEIVINGISLGKGFTGNGRISFNSK